MSEGTLEYVRLQKYIIDRITGGSKYKDRVWKENFGWDVTNEL